MDISVSTLKEIEEITKRIIGKTNQNNCPYEIGKNYLICTQTKAISGTIKWVGEKEIVMSSAALVAYKGRFSDALKNLQNFVEVEPYENDVIIGRRYIVDATQIKNIITEQNKEIKYI